MSKQKSNNANHRKPKNVKIVVLERKKLQRFFEACASAAAANMVSRVETTKYTGVHVKVDLKRYRTLRAQCLAATWSAFFRFADRGPKVLARFLTQKQSDLSRDIAAKREKFRRANGITEEFATEYNRSISFTHQVRTTGLLAIIVLPVALKLSVAKACALGIGYGVTCSMAQTLSEAACSQIIMLVDKPSKLMKRTAGVAAAAGTKAAIRNKCGVKALDNRASRGVSELTKRVLPKVAKRQARKQLGAKLLAALGKSAAAGAGAVISILCLSDDLVDAVGGDYAERRDRQRKSFAHKNRRAANAR